MKGGVINNMKGGVAMEVINGGVKLEDVILEAGMCTEEPDDNCWLQLD